jgi:hypothetical protein
MPMSTLTATSVSRCHPKRASASNVWVDALWHIIAWSSSTASTCTHHPTHFKCHWHWASQLPPVQLFWRSKMWNEHPNLQAFPHVVPSVRMRWTCKHFRNTLCAVHIIGSTGEWASWRLTEPAIDVEWISQMIRNLWTKAGSVYETEYYDVGDINAK